MADSFVRRTAPSIAEVHPLKRSLTYLFDYSPLDHSIGSIRLLILEPAENKNALICCRLELVAFSQKPKYEALSYTWGSNIVRHTLSIGGREFEVGQNLYEALRHLRDPLKDRALWVDAICINQSDVTEKNQQIGIMPFIYMRAKMVLVWLGVPEDGADQLWNWKDAFESTNVSARDTGEILLHALCDNPYWKRVWIIQEVGVAKRLLVHYGAYQVEWKTFIERINLQPGFEHSLPVKLQKQIDEKFDNGHRLQALIENYRDSLCKEPRDHIYGFVGLAVDSQEGFPIDYGKSLYEVWKDVIRFKNAHQPEPEFLARPAIDTIRFGRIVLGLLGGTKIATADEVARDISLELDGHQEYQSKLGRDKIWIPGRVAGKIVHIGPTYQEIMSNPKAVASWRASINRHLDEDDQPSAREESEVFLGILEDATQEDLEIVFSFDREIISPVANTPYPTSYVDEHRLPAHQNSEPADIDTASLRATSKLTCKGPRLYLLGGGQGKAAKAPGKLGLASADARVGDYVSLIHGSEKAIVVRMEGKRVKVVGTAAPAENRYVARAAQNGNLKRENRFGTTDLEDIWDPRYRQDKLDLFIDIATVYQIVK